MKESILIALAFVVAIFGIDAARAADHKLAIANNEELKLELDDGTKTTATFFNAKGERAVVFLPGGVGTKESYYFLASRLQKIDIASLSLDGRSESALLSAIDYLRKKGFGKLSLVGGSNGAATILIAVKYSISGTPRDIIDKVVLISPYGGSALKSDKIKKLFIASKEDSISSYTGIQNLYNDTSDPKTMRVYDGASHAEQLFEDELKEDVAQVIIDFIRAEYGTANSGNNNPLSVKFPIPADTAIVAPPQNVGREIAAFSGFWVGNWPDYGTETALIVEEINSRKARVVYCLGESTGVYTVPASCERYEAALSQKHMQIEFVIGETLRFAFRMMGNLNQIKAIKQSPLDQIGMIMTKIKD